MFYFSYNFSIFLAECLLSVTSKVNANLSLDALLVPALQTPSLPGWPQTNQWHVCRFLLPPSEFYAVVNRRRSRQPAVPGTFIEIMANIPISLRFDKFLQKLLNLN